MRTKKRRTPDNIDYSLLLTFMNTETENTNLCCTQEPKIKLRYVYNDASFNFWRLKLGLTQKELAICLNTRNHYICAVETRNLSHMVLKRHFEHIIAFNAYIESLAAYILKEEIK